MFIIDKKSYRVQSIIPLYVSSPSPFCKVCRRVFITVQEFKTHNILSAHQLKGDLLSVKANSSHSDHK